MALLSLRVVFVAQYWWAPPGAGSVQHWADYGQCDAESDIPAITKPGSGRVLPGSKLRVIRRTVIEETL